MKRIRSDGACPKLSIAPQNSVEIQEDLDAVFHFRQSGRYAVVARPPNSASLRSIGDVQHFLTESTTTPIITRIDGRSTSATMMQVRSVAPSTGSRTPPEIDDRNHLAAQVDDAEHVVRHLRPA
jgi:hypothetical protein